MKKTASRGGRKPGLFELMDWNVGGRKRKDPEPEAIGKAASELKEPSEAPAEGGEEQRLLQPILVLIRWPHNSHTHRFDRRKRCQKVPRPVRLRPRLLRLRLLRLRLLRLRLHLLLLVGSLGISTRANGNPTISTGSIKWRGVSKETISRPVSVQKRWSLHQVASLRIPARIPSDSAVCFVACSDLQDSLSWIFAPAQLPFQFQPAW